jgi:uncharacterized membrane protein
MKPRAGTTALLLWLFALALFVWRTSTTLPPIVASHFAANGAANGFMPRGFYVILLLVLIIGVPLLLAFLPTALADRGGQILNLPNREYWLAAARREHTLEFVRLHGQWFAAAVALFMAYVHWLVLRANARQPPALSTFGITAGLVTFFLLLVVWLFILFARFRRRA